MNQAIWGSGGCALIGVEGQSLWSEGFAPYKLKLYIVIIIIIIISSLKMKCRMKMSEEI